jgi:hypothetical protein
MLEVGTIVEAVVSDYYTDETGSVVTCRVEEVVDPVLEIVRVSFPEDREEDRASSRVHGRVVREVPTEAWETILLALEEAGIMSRSQYAEMILKAVIAWRDVECRNVLREAGRKA